MPRIKETSAILLESKLPLAIAEGWTVHALAKACHCGERAAGEALQRYRQAMKSALAVEAGSLLSQMQKEAALERPAVIRRLRETGAAADDLLAKAREAIEALQIGSSLVDAGDEGEDDQPSHRGRRAPSVEARLASLAAVVKSAASASRESWLCFKDACGLSFAEEGARQAMRQKAGNVGPVLVANVLVELDGEG